MNMHSEPIRVLLADDHRILREGLKALLKGESDIRLVGEASTGSEAVSSSVELSPSVVILDITMPGLNGLQATSQIVARVPSTKVIILSMTCEEEFVVQAIDAGASGYLIKDTAASELLTAIREVQKGNAFFSPAVSKILLERQKRRESRQGKSVPEELTHRERDVLQMLCDGYTSKEISDRLAIGVKSVEKLRQQMMDKLGIHDVALLVRYAIRTGIVREDRTQTVSALPKHPR